MYFYESKKDFFTQLTGLLQNLNPANTILLICKNDWLLETDEQEKSIFTTFEERDLKILFKSKNGKKIFDKDSINYFIVKSKMKQMKIRHFCLSVSMIKEKLKSY